MSEAVGVDLGPVDVLGWLARSNAAGGAKPILNFEQFWDDAFLIRLFDGPTPKRRRDFHINSTAEFFYQVQGELTCTLLIDGDFVHKTCKQGEMFWIPPLVPHLNEREVGSVGLVIHGQRSVDAVDSMVWYCDGCGETVHRFDYAFEKDLKKLLGPRIREFLASEALRTCKRCGQTLPDDLGFM